MISYNQLQGRLHQVAGFLFTVGQHVIYYVDIFSQLVS